MANLVKRTNDDAPAFFYFLDDNIETVIQTIGATKGVVAFTISASSSNVGEAGTIHSYFNPGVTGFGRWQPQQTITKNIDAGPAVDLGGGKVGIPVTDHGIEPLMRIRFTGTTNYSSETYFVQDATTENQIAIEDTYNAEVFSGTETVFSIGTDKPGKIFFNEEFNGGFPTYDYNVLHVRSKDRPAVIALEANDDVFSSLWSGPVFDFLHRGASFNRKVIRMTTDSNGKWSLTNVNDSIGYVNRRLFEIDLDGQALLYDSSLKISRFGNIPFLDFSVRTFAISSDPLGAIRFGAGDGSFEIGAEIQATAEGQWSSGNYKPTKIDIATQANTGVNELAYPSISIDSSQRVFIGDYIRGFSYLFNRDGSATGVSLDLTGTLEASLVQSTGILKSFSQFGGQLNLNNNLGSIGNGYQLGYIDFTGKGFNQRGARIIGKTFGAWTESADDSPTRIDFYTQSDGTSNEIGVPKISIGAPGAINRANIVSKSFSASSVESLYRGVDSSDNELFNVYPTGSIVNKAGISTADAQYGAGFSVSNLGDDIPEHTNGVGSYDHTGGASEQLFTSIAGDAFTQADEDNGNYIMLFGTNNGAIAKITNYIDANNVQVEGLGWDGDLASQPFYIYKKANFLVSEQGAILNSQLQVNGTLDDPNIVSKKASGALVDLYKGVDELGNDLFRVTDVGSIINKNGINTSAMGYGAAITTFNYGEDTPLHTNGVGSYDHTGGGLGEQLFTSTVGDVFTQEDADKGNFVLLLGANRGAIAEIVEYIDGNNVIVSGLGWDMDFVSQGFFIYNHPGLILGDGNVTEFSTGASGVFAVASYDFVGDNVTKFSADIAAEGVNAVKVDVDVNGYTDCTAFDIQAMTGDLQPGDVFNGFALNIDDTGAGSADDTTHVRTLSMHTTNASAADNTAIEVGPGFTDAMRVTGTPSDDPGYGYEVTITTVVDRVNSGGAGNDAFVNPAVDETLFSNDNDYILIGSDNTFEIINVILDTASNKEIKPDFYYSKAGGNWTAFDPEDDTRGFRNSGNIAFDAPGDWTKDDEAEADGDITNAYYVKIQRTNDAVATLPIESYFKTFVDRVGGMNVRGDGVIKLPYLTTAPPNLENGMMWMENNGLHIYYNDTESSW